MLSTGKQQMLQYQDRMNRPYIDPSIAVENTRWHPSQEQELIKQGGPQQTAQILTQPNWQNPQQTSGIMGLGGLAGNRNLQDRLKFFSDFQQGGGQHPLRTPQYPSRPKQFDVAGGFEEFGETLGGYKETLGGYGEQLGGFGETLGGYGEQISGFEEQLGGFGEQFSGMQEQVGGVGEDINEINERLGGIEEGISTLKISKPEQKQNPYANMFNPFSFIGNWGGSRSRMSYR
jgi:hypothetical protein